MMRLGGELQGSAGGAGTRVRVRTPNLAAPRGCARLERTR